MVITGNKRISYAFPFISKLMSCCSTLLYFNVGVLLSHTSLIQYWCISCSIFHSSFLNDNYLIFSSLFWGYLADRISKKYVFIISSIGTALFTIAFGFTTSFKWAIVTKFAAGCCAGKLSSITYTSCPNYLHLAHLAPLLVKLPLPCFTMRFILFFFVSLQVTWIHLISHKLTFFVLYFTLFYFAFPFSIRCNLALILFASPQIFFYSLLDIISFANPFVIVMWFTW